VKLDRRVFRRRVIHEFGNALILGRYLNSLNIQAEGDLLLNRTARKSMILEIVWDLSKI
jgi:hypothetical protein